MVNIREIISEEIFKIQEGIAQATGFGIVFTDASGQHLGEGSNFQRFCRMVNKIDEGQKFCTASNAAAMELARKTKKPIIYVCHAGMINIAAPLFIGGELIGAATAGNVISQDLQNLVDLDMKSDQDWYKYPQIIEAYKNVPVLSKTQISGTAIALDNLVKYITSKYEAENMNRTMLIQEQELNKLKIQRQAFARELAETRFNMLQKQIAPHFIFNALNSIDKLMELEDSAKAQSTLQSLARMLRVHYREKTSNVSLSREISYIRDYLQIQKTRFGERIDYEINVPEIYNRMLIPLFSLQPFVENAIEHGIVPSAHGGKILIKAENFIRFAENVHEKDMIKISIIDNGVGIQAKRLNQIQSVIRLIDDESCKEGLSGSTGIINCVERLRCFYKNNLHISIQSHEGQGTSVEIIIPVVVP